MRKSDPEPEPYIPIREAAARKGVSVATIRNWVLAGRVRRERRIRVDPDAVRTVYAVSWPDVEKIEPMRGPGRARRT